MDQFDRAALYVNARSRRGAELFRSAHDCLRRSGLTLADARADRDPRALFRRVETAVQSGIPLVIVGGGDGTLSLVARHFVGHDATLGVLPLGTGNALARDLQIPFDVASACDAILNGKTSQVDLGHAGDDYFVNVVTVGLSARIVMELTDEAKRRFGRAVYFFAMCRALSRVRPFHARLVTPEGTLEFDTLQVVIGNGRYHAGPFPLSPDASITEGRLTVYGLANTNRAAFLRLAWHLRTGRHVDLPEVHALATTGGHLETDPPREVVMDGEISLKTPLDFRVAPGALRVRTPKAFQG